MANTKVEWNAYYQGIRDHQIGENGGMSFEAAEELGFRLPKAPHSSETTSTPEREPNATDVAATGSAALLANTSEKKRPRRTRKKLSQTPAAIRARTRRAKLNTEIDQRIAENADPWGSDLGGI